MKEIWKPCVGYEGFYKISNYSTVRSVKRNGTRGIILKKIIDTDGYEICCLMKLGYRTNKKVHRLVAQAFIPNPKYKPQVNHLDNDRKNNLVKNLEWVTPMENVKHMVKQKRHRHNKLVQVEKPKHLEKGEDHVLIPCE